MCREEVLDKHFEMINAYLMGEEAYKDVAKEYGFAPKTFIRLLKHYYRREYLVFKGHKDKDSSETLRQCLTRLAGDNTVETFVVKKCISDVAFARVAAKPVFDVLIQLLGDNEEVNIGLVSGSAVSRTVEQLVTNRFWEEIDLDPLIKSKPKKVNIMALNITSVLGWDLEYNANNTVLLLSTFLCEKFKNSPCEVKPFGLGSTLVVSSSQRKRIDKMPANEQVLKYADPSRLDQEGPSKLNMVITGVGCPKDSLFNHVIQTENLETYDPNGKDDKMVGDVAFSPLNADGKELSLRKIRTKKGGYFVYSALKLDVMKQLVEAKAKVILITRNRQKDPKDEKTSTILAATKAAYYNYLITDDKIANATKNALKNKK